MLIYSLYLQNRYASTITPRKECYLGFSFYPPDMQKYKIQLRAFTKYRLRRRSRISAVQADCATFVDFEARAHSHDIRRIPAYISVCHRSSFQLVGRLRPYLPRHSMNELCMCP